MLDTCSWAICGTNFCNCRDLQTETFCSNVLVQKFLNTRSDMFGDMNERNENSIRSDDCTIFFQERKTFENMTSEIAKSPAESRIKKFLVGNIVFKWQLKNKFCNLFLR